MSDMEPANRTDVIDTDDPHYVIDRLLRLREAKPWAQFGGGLRTTFSSVKFMWQHKELWPKVAIPAAINVIVFIFTAGLLLWNADWFMLAEPSKGAWTYYVLIVLWWIYKIVLYPLLIVVSYFLTLLLAGIIAAPFNDALSEATEHIMLGEVVPAEEGWQALVAGGLRGIAMEILMTVPRLFLVILLGIIPAVGPLLAAVVGAYFIAQAYSDYVFERRKYTFAQRFRTIWKHRPMALGFGAGANLLLIIPLLNFLCMPIAVVGGTALALTLDEFENSEDPAAQSAASSEGEA